MDNPDTFIDLSIPGTFQPDILEVTSPLPESTGISTSPTDGLSTLLTPLTGNAVSQILHVIETIIPELAHAIGHMSGTSLGSLVSRSVQYVEHGLAAFEHNQIFAWENMSKYLPTSAFYNELLVGGLGVDTTKFSDTGKQGITTVDTMLGFAVMMQLASAGISTLSKLILGERIGETVAASISKIPEDMGLSWALGMQLDEGFSTAVGETIREEINIQKRSNRIDWRVLKALVKQHTLDSDTFRHLLALQGFPDYQIDLIAELQDVFIPVGDLQAMFFTGIIDKAEVEKQLSRLGFNDDEVSKLTQLYVDKASTASGAMLRSVARTLALNRIITVNDYKGYLDETNFPAHEVDFDVKALELELDNGRIRQTVGVIKAEYLHNKLNDDTAIAKLQSIGYTRDAAFDLVQTWQFPRIKTTHGLTVSQILSYMISGIITASQAYSKLLDAGMNATDAEFLVEHPNAHTGIRIHPRTPSLVTQAYLDGAINIDNLDDAYRSAGVANEDIPYQHAIAAWRYSHRKASDAGHVPLSKAEILDAFHFGLYDAQTTIAALEHLGYTSEDALILLEIKNKGKLQPPQVPLFDSVSAAIAYLEGLGWKVVPPPDPHLGAAEAMVSGAGYGLIPPPVGPVAPGP